MTIYWMMNESAFLLGLWWWIIEPIAMLVILFVGLFLLTAGLDELANPAPAPRRGLTMGLQVRDLNVTYRIPSWRGARGRFRQLRRRAGERLGLVGESGSGKTTTALALMQMLRAPGRCEGGTAVDRRHRPARASPARPCASIACAPSATSRKAR